MDSAYWRSFLFVPAINDRFIESATRRNADVLQIDLEDSVADADKPAARQRVRAIARRFAERGYSVAVRINRPWRMAIQDIEATVDESVSVLTLPKVPDASYVRFIAEALDECEREQGLAQGHTRLIAMVEDAEGLANMADIARAHPRLYGMIVGAEDLALNLRMRVCDDALYMPNVLAVAACRRAGIVPIGFIGSVADFSDEADFQARMARASRLGFQAAFCIHPRQVDIINATFSVTDEEMQDARELIATFEQQMQAGRATCTFKGRMVDLPVVMQARQLLQKYQAQHRNPA